MATTVRRNDTPATGGSNKRAKTGEADGGTAAVRPSDEDVTALEAARKYREAASRRWVDASSSLERARGAADEAHKTSVESRSTAAQAKSFLERAEAKEALAKVEVKIAADAERVAREAKEEAERFLVRVERSREVVYLDEAEEDVEEDDATSTDAVVLTSDSEEGQTETPATTTTICSVYVANHYFRESVKLPALPRDGRLTFANIQRAADTAFGFPPGSLRVLYRGRNMVPLVQNPEATVPSEELETTFTQFDYRSKVNFRLDLDEKLGKSPCPRCSRQPMLSHVRVFREACSGCYDAKSSDCVENEPCENCDAGFFDRSRLCTYDGAVIYLYLDHPSGPFFACGSCIQKELQARCTRAAKP